jgi:hypothetical protein
MASRGVKDKVLDDDKRRIIRLQAEIVRSGGFFLAGGTGLGLRLGHRLSDDLDWFTPRPFSVKELMSKLEELPEKPTLLRQDGHYTLRAYYGTLETSFIRYEQVPAQPEASTVARAKIPIADLDVLAVMKAAVLHDRGARRDFIDVHAISTIPGWSVGRFIDHGARHLPLGPEQIALALTYFADAEKDPMPRGCKVSWAKVKATLTKGIREWQTGRKHD